MNATVTRPQSTMIAPISTASAPPEMTAISFPPQIQPRQAQMTISTASNPSIPPTMAADCLTVQGFTHCFENSVQLNRLCT